MANRTEDENKTAVTEIPPAEERANVKRGRDRVTDGSSDDPDVLPSARVSGGGGGASPGGWSHEGNYAHANKGGTSVAAREADRDRERRQNMRESWEFRKKYGMSKAEYDTLQRFKAEAKAREAKFVAGAKAGKFAGNIYLGGRNWELLSAGVDENGNLSETVDLGENGKNGAAMKELNEWARAINANDGSRYGGRYNMTALPKGIFMRDANGDWQINASMITSQAQVNALLKMKAQDDARQGKWKTENARRVAATAMRDRRFLENNAAYTKEALDEMNADQIIAAAGAIRQENVEQGVREGDEERVRRNRGSATQRNRAAGRPDTQAEFDRDTGMDLIDWENPIDFDKMLDGDPQDASPSSEIEPEPESIPPATPKEQSPKTSASPKVTEEEDR